MRPRPAHVEALPSWDFLDRWRMPASELQQPTWAAVVRWDESARNSVAGAARELAEHVKRWEAWLEPLGEISSQDWREFRPLQLGREEGWSDWLAHLLARSTTGLFARELLQRHPELAGVSSFAELHVRREVETDGGERRADLLIERRDAAAHIEVKAGDRAFKKTYDTAECLEEKYRGNRAWADFILLLPSDVDRWRAEVREDDPRVIVDVTWRDVAVALRRAIKRDDESLHWRTWAHAFCGAVEQRLLGCEPSIASLHSGLEQLAAAIAQLDVMKRAEE